MGYSAAFRVIRSRKRRAQPAIPFCSERSTARLSASTSSVITDPAALRELWGLTGQDIATDVDLMPVMPFYRLNWRDGTSFDYSNDDAQLHAEIARLNTDDVAGYRRLAGRSEPS